MIIYENTHIDPYFNLASEQYLLDTAQEDIFMLWRNEPVVVIGKNQNAYAEINADFVKEQQIKVVRRLTGGGAVFHDLDNINFTFIVSKEKCGSLDFAYFTQPMIEALEQLGVKAELQGRNDLVIDGQKISGNAQCVYNEKIMHHGTLLFAADMSRLVGALNVNEEKVKSKGIKSIRNRVTNIQSHLAQAMDTVAFKEFLENYIAKKYSCQKTAFSVEAESAIQHLADMKYATWEWNYGKSKEYTVSNRKYFEFGSIEMNVNVDAGKIKEVRIDGDYFGIKDIREVEQLLFDVPYEKEKVMEILQKCPLQEYILGATAEEMQALLFTL